MEDLHSQTDALLTMVQGLVEIKRASKAAVVWCPLLGPESESESGLAPDDEARVRAVFPALRFAVVGTPGDADADADSAAAAAATDADADGSELWLTRIVVEQAADAERWHVQMTAWVQTLGIVREILHKGLAQRVYFGSSLSEMCDLESRDGVSKMAIQNTMALSNTCTRSFVSFAQQLLARRQQFAGVPAILEVYNRAESVLLARHARKTQNFPTETLCVAVVMNAFRKKDDSNPFFEMLVQATEELQVFDWPLLLEFVCSAPESSVTGNVTSH